MTAPAWSHGEITTQTWYHGDMVTQMWYGNMTNETWYPGDIIGIVSWLLWGLLWTVMYNIDV